MLGFAFDFLSVVDFARQCRAFSLFVLRSLRKGFLEWELPAERDLKFVPGDGLLSPFVLWNLKYKYEKLELSIFQYFKLRTI